MQRILLSLVFVFSFILASPAESVEFKKDQHYSQLEQPIGSKSEVVEFFSFYCPACYRQEPVMKTIKQSLPQHVPFVKNHVDGMPGRNVRDEQRLTKALIAANKLGVSDKVIPAIFNGIHQSRKKAFSEAELKALFIEAGIEADRFDKTINSFAIKAHSKKMQKNTAAIRALGYSGVPTLVIHGKYVPNIKALKSFEEYVELVVFLANQKG